MGRIRRTAATLVGAACLVTVLAACEPNYTVQVTGTNLAIPCSGTTNVNANWAIPDEGTPTGFIWLQHGFARSNSVVEDLQRKYASRGWVVVAPSISAFGTCSINAAVLHAGVANLIAGSTSPGSALQTSYDAARAAQGRAPAALPSNLALSGHSAGGAMVTVVGGAIATNPAPAVSARLKGIMLLDPVENANNGMAANLPALASTPVLTVSAPNSSCNANSSGTNVLLANRSGFAGVRLTSGCHCDAEADTTNFTCTLVCGTPSTQNKNTLKQLTADWVSDMLRGKIKASAYPGGDYYQLVLDDGVVQTLNGTA